ncbi:MAG: ribonuclease P protein component [Anaerolineaceae bacterium]
MISRKHRLRSSADFRTARKSGKVYKHPLVTVVTSPNGAGLIRVGIISGKPVGGAVMRNLVKRRLRACMNEQLSVLKEGWDIVIIARPKSGLVAFSELQTALGGLLNKAGLIKPADRLL